MAKFEVGGIYCRADRGFDPVVVTKRTDKTIWVTQFQWGGPSGASWSMRIRTDEDGNEWAVDHQNPRSWWDEMKFQAKYEETETRDHR